MTEALNALKKIQGQVGFAKALIRNYVDAGRILPTEDIVNETKDIALKLSTDLATIEGDLNLFSRQTVGSKRYFVKK